MRKQLVLGIFCALALTACGSSQDGFPPQEASTPTDVQLQTASPIPSEDSWYEKLITDSSYSLEDALKEHPEEHDDFTGDIIFDNLHTGNLSQSFNLFIPAGSSIKFTIMCRSDSPWSSTLSPIHTEFMGGGGNCFGQTSFETKPLSEDLSTLTLEVTPDHKDMTYRVILEITGDS